MAEFKEIASELIKEAEAYRKEYCTVTNNLFSEDKNAEIEDSSEQISKTNTTSSSITCTTSESQQVNVNETEKKISVIGSSLGGTMGLIAGLAVAGPVGAVIGATVGLSANKAIGEMFENNKSDISKGNSYSYSYGTSKSYCSDLLKTIINFVKEADKDKFTIKDISTYTGIEDWKLRRYIASKDLIAEVKDSNSKSNNPGKAGYLITKENLIDFIKNKKEEIKETEGFLKAIEQVNKDITENKKQFIESFLRQVLSTISLGTLEIELDELKEKKGEISREDLLEKKILLQKLIFEKNFFKDQQLFVTGN